MSDYLHGQLDYIYFVYGSSMLILFLVASFLSRSSDSRIRWKLLGYFALTSGLSKWVEMILQYDFLKSLEILYFLLSLLSYLFLLEFGRSGIDSYLKRRDGYWLYIIAFVPPSFLSFYHGGGLIAATCFFKYFACFVSGAAASTTLYLKASKHEGKEKRILSACALLFLFYTVVTSLVSPESSFIPASCINYRTFLEYCGFPVQVLQLTLVFIASYCLWQIARINSARSLGFRDKALDGYGGFFLRNRPMFAILATMVGGWFFANIGGRYVEDAECERLLEQSALTSMAVNVRGITRLKMDSTDLESPDYIRLKEQIVMIKSASPRYRFFYIVAKDLDGKMRILVDSEDPSSTDTYSPPGQSWDEAPREIYSVFEDRVPKMLCYEDRWGKWISAFYPVVSANSVVAVAGVDMALSKISAKVAIGRLVPITITLLITVLIIFFSFIIDRNNEFHFKQLKSQQTLNAVFDSSSFALLVCDLDGQIESLNNRAMQIFGLSESSLKKYNFTRDLISPFEDRAKMQRVWREATRGMPQRFEGKIVRPLDGSYLPAELGFVSFNDGVGDHVLVSLSDITDRKHFESELLAAKDWSELLYRTIPSAVFTVDTDKTVTSWNKMAEEITGYSASEIIGRQCTVFGKAPCREKCGLFADDVKKPIRNKECVIETKDGRLIKVIKNADMIVGPDGSMLGGIESFENITEIKNSQERLEDALNELERLNLIMTGREERILDLKQEINGLREKLGLEGRYRLD